MRAQATEALDPAVLSGEEVTTLAAKVSLSIGELVGVLHSAVDEMMGDMLVYERAGIDLCARSATLLRDGTSRSRSSLDR